MSVNKIEYTESHWRRVQDDSGEWHLEKHVSDPVTVTREEYNGDFDDLILRSMDNGAVAHYAEWNLDMHEDGECPKDTRDPDRLDSSIMISILRARGFEILKAPTITDRIKLEELLEEFQTT